MTPPEEISRVASGLSEAERRTILNMSDRYRPAKEIGTSGALLMRLAGYVLGDDYMHPFQLTLWDVDDGPGGPLMRVWALSNNGLTVRSHLEAQTKDQSNER